ncbi:HdeD family acid-resistance protein [Corallococcus sp. H22C18031201]|uniref:HdeD family acid-resistance protein n=1 Tax=Citreicoccus inhibens TaxID=2849499 RepID=UPI000E76E5D3|nr:HdeD family acid-resistance protein [Citreicoccus inhibens]MBU8894786.1 HdeD family acid-resistance protein [Citreicoccus inhibens]RJS17636.1 HdeD family acid-resistance protein [Corallococcus sp. H22C18031201]
MATTQLDRGPETNQGRLSRNASAVWGGTFLLGLLMAVLGFIMLGEAAFASVLSIVFVGALLTVGGIAEIVAAFRSRSAGGPFLSFLLAGILTMVVGLLVLRYPGAGLGTITLLLAGFFFASGLFHAITSVVDRYPQWGWDLAYGLVSIFLGITVMSQWPISSAWLLGTLVGVGLLMRGVAMMSGSLAIRRGMRALSH